MIECKLDYKASSCSFNSINDDDRKLAEVVKVLVDILRDNPRSTLTRQTIGVRLKVSSNGSSTSKY